MSRFARHITLIALCSAVLMSCEREDTLEYQQRQIAVVDAFLKSGENISNININTLTINGESSGISDLDIHIRSDEGNYFLEESEEVAGNYFYSDRDHVFVPGASYDLTFDFKGKIVSAETSIPPAMETLSISSNTFRSGSEGELIWIDWTDLNVGSTAEYFYLVKLTPLEEFDVLVKIEGRSNEETTPLLNSRSVLLNPEATLSVDDFAYYGI